MAPWAGFGVFVRYKSVAIEGLTHHVPDVVISTAAIEQMLAPTYQRLHIATGTLEAMTGVEARRFCRAGIQPSDLATLAAGKLLEETGFDRSRIGVLVSTSVCKDYLEPSVAALVHGNLGLPANSANFDVGNACLGFMSGLTVVANMIELGQIEAGLVVVGEGSRDVTMATARRLQREDTTFADFRGNLATLTLGSGSCAMLLVHERLATTSHRLLGSTALSATHHNRLCIGTAQSMHTDAPKLLQEGVALARRTWVAAQQGLELSSDQVKSFALHQVGRPNHEAVIRALEVPDDRAIRIYPSFGNVGSAGVPMAMSAARDDGWFGAGDTVMMMGIGSGLNTQMMRVEW
jgi:3-oxoacyl-[acyl-carrier-protein] synthase III